MYPHVAFMTLQRLTSLNTTSLAAMVSFVSFRSMTPFLYAVRTSSTFLSTDLRPLSTSQSSFSQYTASTAYPFELPGFLPEETIVLRSGPTVHEWVNEDRAYLHLSHPKWGPRFLETGCYTWVPHSVQDEHLHRSRFPQTRRASPQLPSHARTKK